jgi:hypothetical protein
VTPASRPRRIVPALAVGLGLLAAGFRAVHLATPSLWWDELVHIQIAARPPALLLPGIKWGPVPHAGGNAGAMPLDYVLLHLYRAVTPAPAPEHLEAYWRLPAYVYSVAAVVVVTLLLGRDGGAAAAALGGAMLAFSVPAALYAAEARPYSLLVLLAALQLLALGRLATRWHDRGAWIGFAAVALLFVGTGLPAVPVLAVEGVVLLALAARRGRLAAAGLGLGGTALGLGAAALAYFRGVDLAAGFGRDAPADPALVTSALSFLATGEYRHPAAILLLAAAPAFAIAHASRRAPRSLPVLAFAIASFAALPALLLLIRWKAYYFHVRHALVLLPALAVVLTHACLGAADLVARGRPAVQVLLAGVLVAALAAPPAIAFVHEPYRFFRSTKTVQDWKAVAQRLDRASRERSILLVAESRSRADERASYVGAWYLRARGLERRVLFCTTPDLERTVRLLALARRLRELDLLDFGCTSVLALERPGLAVEARTNLGALTDRRTLPAGVGDGGPPPPPRIRRFAFVSFDPPPPLPGLEPAAYPGLVLLEAAGAALSPPGSPRAPAAQPPPRGG